jgi:hypothetical protein
MKHPFVVVVILLSLVIIISTKESSCPIPGHYWKEELNSKIKLKYTNKHGNENEEIIENRIQLNNESIVHTFNLKKKGILLKYNLTNGNVLFRREFPQHFIESNFIQDSFIYLSGKYFNVTTVPEPYLHWWRKWLDNFTGHSWNKIYGVFILKIDLNSGELLYRRIIGHSRFFRNEESTIHSLKNYDSNSLLLSGNYYNLFYPSLNQSRTPLYSNHLNYCFVSKINKENGSLVFIQNLIGACHQVELLEKDKILMTGKYKKRFYPIDEKRNLIGSFTFDIYFSIFDLNSKKYQYIRNGGSFFYNDEILSSTHDHQHLYLLGYSMGESKFENLKLSSPPPNRSIFLLKYSLKNGKIQWSKKIGNDAQLRICKYGMVMDSFHSLYLSVWINVNQEYHWSILKYNTIQGDLIWKEELNVHRSNLALSSESCEMIMNKNQLYSTIRMMNQSMIGQSHSSSLLFNFENNFKKKCVPCERGHYLKNQTCLPCPMNTFQDQESSLECLPCPMNTFTRETGSTSCLNNIISTSTTSTSHSLCPPGTILIVKGNNIKYCVECERGTFSKRIGSIACSKCPPGLFADKIGSKRCSHCPTGKVSLDSIHCVPIQSFQFPIQIVFFLSLAILLYFIFPWMKKYVERFQRLSNLPESTQDLFEENLKLKKSLLEQTDIIENLQTKIHHLTGNDLDKLSIKQLQELNRTQLISIQKLMHIYEERFNFCEICLENVANTILLPCRHQVICSNCNCSSCPVCKTDISSVVEPLQNKT